MNITYHTSDLSPDCFFVAVDGVLVGMWDDRSGCSGSGRWVVYGIYRPLREWYRSVEWKGKKFDLSHLGMLEEFNYVKLTGHEVPPFDANNPSDREEMIRWGIRLDELN